MCGGNFYTTTGSITSPGWPHDYSENKDCTWIIHAPTGRQIEIDIKTFELEGHRDCNIDFLEIR